MNNFVMCYRCLHCYDITKAPRRHTKKLKVKEPACPKCKCKLYFSRQSQERLSLSFEKTEYTANED